MGEVEKLIPAAVEAVALEPCDDTLRELLARLEAINGREYHFPWRVVPSDGKPIIAGARSGNLFRGFIATWPEADLAVAAVNALPALLSELSRRQAAIAAKDARIAELEAENARLWEGLEKVKPECGLGCRGEYDDGRCGLNGGLPCCTVRLALCDALAAAGKKEEGR